MKISGQTIKLSGLRFYAFHGVEPQERVVGAWYTVDIAMRLIADGAIENDSLEGTVDYACVTKVVRDEMRHPCNLLEHLAGRIAGCILDRFPLVTVVSVTVSKNNPPVAVPAESASFRIDVERD